MPGRSPHNGDLTLHWRHRLRFRSWEYIHGRRYCWPTLDDVSAYPTCQELAFHAARMAYSWVGCRCWSGFAIPASLDWINGGYAPHQLSTVTSAHVTVCQSKSIGRLMVL